MSSVEISVSGLESLDRLNVPSARAALESGMLAAAIAGANQAKLLAPVDTGRFRASITGEIRWEGADLVGVVGSNVDYAPEIEYGTGAMGDPDVPHVSAHWPPAAALNGWASRHGFASGAQVARIIGRRGGLVARRVFRTALFNPSMLSVMTALIKRSIDAFLEEHG